LRYFRQKRRRNGGRIFYDAIINENSNENSGEGVNPWKK